MESNDLLIAVTCPECNIQFSRVKALELHLIEQHQKVKEEPELCNTENQNVQEKGLRTSFQKNIKRQSPAELFPCQSCSYVTKTKQLLHKHVQTRHNLHRKIFSCHLCMYYCLQERTFNLHLSKHTNVEAKFACDQCGKLFMSMSIMKRHALTHNKTKPFICDFEGCDKRFNIRSRLTDHQRSVHKFRANNSGDKHKIKRVPQTLCRENVLKLDKSNSKGNNSSVIPDDHYIAGENSLCKMSEHINSFVPDDIGSSQSLAYICGNEDYRSDADISQHPDVVNVYDIILSDPFSFNVSDTSSIDEAHELTSKRHGFFVKNGYLKKDSNNSNKFSCTWKGCGKVFRDNYNLRMHTCTHTGEMQRACKLCGYTCVQKSALDRHMEVHQRTVIK